MTQNEVNILKNAFLDANEAYVDARLQVADFVKTQVGVVQLVEVINNKYYHTVKCNATSNTEGVIYRNLLSINNIRFPVDSIVYLVAPNSQFSNQFILGALEDVPYNIRNGTIDINDGAFVVDAEGNVTAENLTANVGGNLAGFDITSNGLEKTWQGSNTNSIVLDTAKGIIGSWYYDYSSKYCKENIDFATYTSGQLSQINHCFHNLAVRVDNSSSLSDSGSDATYIITMNHANIVKKVITGGTESTYTVDWSSSDKRNKNTIKPLSNKLSIDLIDNTETKSFKYNDSNGKHYGMIAQDVRKLLDDLGETDAVMEHAIEGLDEENETRTLNYQEYIPHLINYVKDLRAEINALKGNNNG